MPAQRPAQRPLPIGWIVLAIAVFIAGYSFVRLRYAKPGKTFEPSHDIGERVGVKRLLALGYQRIPVDFSRPAEPLAPGRVAPAPAAVSSAPGGLPAELAGALAPKPDIPNSVADVAAPGEVAAAGTYTLQFTCAQTDYRTQIGGILLFRKGREIFLLPTFEPVPSKMLARWKETTVVAGFPTKSLGPGRYTAVICGDRSSRRWEFTVR